MRTHPELAWAAGFFDGEGCFNVKKNKHRAYCRAVISQRGPEIPEVLLKFQEAVGLGDISGPFSQRPPHTNGYFQYRAFGLEKTQAIVAMLWPYLCGVKRTQAARVLGAMS